MVTFNKIRTTKIIILSLFLILLKENISLNAQWPEQKQHIVFSNVQLSNILDSISSVCKVYLSYNSDLPAIHKVKSINCKCTLYEALSQLLEGENIQFSISGNHIILTSIEAEVTELPIPKPIERYITLKGKIIDKNSSKPLSFTSIAIAGSSIGTVANNNGEFTLKIPPEFRAQSVIFSFLGYEQLTFLVDSLTKAEKIISLSEKNIKISPVLIKYVVGEYVVEQAMKLVAKNYPVINSMYTGFYREAIKQENDYVSVCEAIIDIAKSPYNSSFSKDQAHISKGRKIQNLKIAKKLKFKLEGGIYNCLQLDIVKNVSSFLSPEYFKMYEYKYIKTIPYSNNHSLYVIEFKQKEAVTDYALYNGILYIDQENKAIVAAKFSLSPIGMKYARSMLVKKEPRKYSIKPVNTEYLVFYKNVNGHYYLDYIRAELKIKARNDKMFFNSLYTSVSEMAITNIDTTNTYRFKRIETAKVDDILIDTQTNYDESFWGSYNTITPEATMTEALKKLNLNQNQGEEKSFWDKLF